MTEQIGRLADNKAAGTDGWGSSLIKQLVGVIELPLVLIFQESLRSGQVPVGLPTLPERAGVSRKSPPASRQVAKTSRNPTRLCIF